VDIASASGTDDPRFESRQGIRFIRENIAMLLCKIDLICIVCVLQKRNKGIAPAPPQKKKKIEELFKFTKISWI
jgi:hypothetical protein